MLHHTHITMTMKFDELFDLDGYTLIAKETIRIGGELIRIGQRMGHESVIGNVALFYHRFHAFDVEVVGGEYRVRRVVG